MSHILSKVTPQYSHMAPSHTPALDHKLKWKELVRLCSNLALGLQVQVGCILGSSWRSQGAAIMSLEMAMARSKTVLSTRSAELEKYCNHSLGYVQGNERRDELAKLDSTTLFIGAEPALPLLQWQKAAVAHAIVWAQCRRADLHMASCPPPAINYPQPAFVLSRAGIRMVTRMLTLHNGLNDHMCRIGRRFNPLYSRCGEGHVTHSHLFKNCVTLVAIKCSIFVSITTTLEEVVHNRRLDKLLKFVSREALCC